MHPVLFVMYLLAGPLLRPNPIRITVMGDSISKEMLRQGDHPLETAFRKARLDARIVGIGRDSDAFGGFTTLNLINLLDGVSGPPCDLVLVLAGTNDLIHRKDPNKVAEGVRMLVNAIHRSHPEARIEVAPLTPIFSYSALGLAPNAVDRVNAGLQMVIPNQGHWVHMLHPDRRGFWSRGEMAGDGIHLTARGYRKLAGRWTEAIASVAPNKDRSKRK